MSDNIDASLILPSFLTTSHGFLLGKLSQRLTRLAEEALLEVGLQAKQVGVLTLIAESGPKSQKEIGDRLEIDRTTMVSLVDGLESSHLVTRKADPTDRRVFLVTLTAQGKRKLTRAQKMMLSTEKRFLSKLSKAERKKFLNLLVTLYKG